MADEGPQAGESWRDTYERRLRAIRTMAQQNVAASAGRAASRTGPDSSDTASAPASLSLAPRGMRSRRGRLPLIVACVLALVIIAIVAVRALQSAPPSNVHAPGQLVIDLTKDGIQCPQDFAWSPDGARLAVIGYQRDCPTLDPRLYKSVPGIVGIYDSRRGVLLAKFQADQPIAAALHLQPVSDVTPVASAGGPDLSPIVEYTHLLWSPDGKRLALTFWMSIITSVQYTSNGASWTSTTINGLLLIDASGRHAQVLSHALGPGEPVKGEWDVSARQLVSTPSGAASASGPGIGPLFAVPALDYSWEPDGTLAGHTLLSASVLPPAPPLAPIGNPDGGRSFTIWQPGEVSLDNATFDTSGHERVYQPGTFVFTARLAAWSPDGRYLLTGDITSWRLRPAGVPAPSAETLRGLGLDRMPLLPVRDAALEAILDHPPVPSLRSGGNPVSLAWSPDGRMLALPLLGTDSAGQPAPAHDRVAIYDCATGKPLARLAPAMLVTNASSSDSFMRWSPDSARLLFYDQQMGSLTIWGPGKLPQR